MELSGRLASFPVGDILQWVHHERRTGSLVVRRSRREKRIFLRKGDIVGCLSDDPAEYYGQHLLLNGYLDEGSLVKALRYCKLQETRLGVAQPVTLPPPDGSLANESIHDNDATCFPGGP